MTTTFLGLYNKPMDYNKTMYRYMCDYCKKHNNFAVVRGNIRLSFEALDREVNRVAAGLFKLGVRKGDVVMSALPNIEQAVPLMYAVSLLGGVFAPVHPLLSEREFAKEVEIQKPTVLAISDINLSRFSRHRGGAKLVYCPYLMPGYFGLPKGDYFEEYTGDCNIPALHMHSGGTSGVPKTVVFSAESANALVHNLLTSIPYEFDSKDAMLVTLPMFHGFGLIVGVHASLCTDMTAVLMPRFTGESALKNIIQNKVTTVIAIPRMLEKLLVTKGFEGEGISTLANVFVGGDTLSKKLAIEFNERMKKAGATAVAQQGYGLTEVGSVCVLAPKDSEPGSIGRAINNVNTVVVDDDYNLLEDGEKGELLIESNQTMLGYMGGEEEAFVKLGDKKYLRTGDVFSKCGEDLTFYGRKKRLIKISGMNVFPSEIERIAKELDYVKNCAAFERVINGKTQIELVIEGELGGSEKEEVRRYIGKNLSHYNVPGIVRCVSAMPFTSIGKIDYQALKNQN